MDNMKIFMVYGYTLDEANGSVNHVVEIFRDLKKKKCRDLFCEKIEKY